MRRKNRLSQETSPYLLSHAENPVDWHPWGPEALARAAKEDKPIFLSIGYSACHWCHVMERESFEDEEVAARLAEGFIAIKVDREERPDLDAVYMTATIAMNGSGGWPMSVFLTPDGRPFFAGTYFPKHGKHGRPGFMELLARIRELWQGERDDLLTQAEELSDAVRAEARASEPRPVDAALEAAAAKQLLASFDPEWGGFGGAPKFPAPFALSLLLRHSHETGDERYRGAALVTLDRMARGGIYDHVGGGFARYSTDARWHVPHFEKMLYDNAQLARVYVEAWQTTGDAALARVARETLDHVAREMQGEHGGYLSATDADSEGVEGKFFVWSEREIRELLPADEAEAVIASFDVRPRGNWEGHNVLWAPRPYAESARELGLGETELWARLERAKSALYAARQKRVPPACDDKVLTAWNGLMIGAMAFAARALSEPRYLASARRAADMISSHATRPDGGLFRAFRSGRAHVHGFLEDYAFLADGLIDLFEASGEYRHLARALALAERAAIDFSGEPGQGFYTTSAQHEVLLTRLREGSDNATASANAVIARVLVRLSQHFGRDDLRALGASAIMAHGRAMSRVPRAFTSSLEVASRLLAPAIEVALIGPEAGVDEMARVVGQRYLPNLVIARAPEGTPPPHPLLEGKRPIAGRATAFVCRDMACSQPASSTAELARELDLACGTQRSDRRPALAPSLHTGVAGQQATRSWLDTRGVEGRSLLGCSVHPSGVLLGGHREPDVREAVALALAEGRNLLAFDLPRAAAVGDALATAFAQGTPRDALLLVAVLHDEVDLARESGRLCDAARISVVDLALAPRESSAAALAELESSTRVARVGLYAERPLAPEDADWIAALPGEIEVLAAPLNLREGAREIAAHVARSGRALIALRPLDLAIGPRVLRLDREARADGEPAAVALAQALGELTRLEDEFRNTIARRLSGSSEAADPQRLFEWAQELGKAERVLDDALEVDAFVSQSVMPLLGAQLGALSSLSEEGPRIASFRERYVDTLTRSLKILAQHVDGRSAALLRRLAVAIVGGDVAALAPSALGAVLASPGVGAALVTVRSAADVPRSSRWSDVSSDLFEQARALVSEGS